MFKNTPVRLLKLTEEINHILSGCINGDRSSQEKLYKLHASKMFAVCLRYCGDYNTAKDILQDGYIKVFENIKQYGAKGSLEGWIRRIIVNTALERFRKNKVILLVDQIPEMPENDTNEETEMDVSMSDMMLLIQNLPSQYRMVFNLYVFENFSHSEIADKLGIAEGSSKSNLSRARAILQQKIKEKNQQIAKVC